MRLSTRMTRIAVAAVCLMLAVTSCSEDNRYADVAVAATAGTTGNADINKDGKVVVLVLSPGNLDDNGYYESFLNKASAFAARQGWSIERQGNIKPGTALAAAKAACAKYKPDLVALGASEIQDAVPAATNGDCGNAYWYVPSSTSLKEQKGILISQDFTFESVIAAGYANGLLMKNKGYSKAGFISGPVVDFSIDAAKAFYAGLKYAMGSAPLEYTPVFTGDLNDGPKAEAAMKQLADDGVKAVYPYLGGGADPAAKVGNARGILLSTPGTNRCDSTSPSFAVSVIFDPGEYFAAALEDFSKGDLKMGTRREWHIGVDQVPTVRFCNGTNQENADLAQFITDIGSGTVNVTNEVNKYGPQVEIPDSSS
ncbi:BMP family ABC transporter substrate-binding protein [Cryptosporangium japonicum]|uniref:ABC transporter substrate-binding protein PnrA-like domain-containing protein n=1 Tax=Cryptosporangium japonicum TaxID=80872 RepID=A0ABP3ECL2_9ACTN